MKHQGRAPTHVRGMSVLARLPYQVGDAHPTIVRQGEISGSHPRFSGTRKTEILSENEQSQAVVVPFNF